MASNHFDLKAQGYRSASSRWPWSRLRQREVSAVMDLLGDVGGCESLDLGCGAGFYTELLLRAGASHVTAVDQSCAMIEQLPRDRVTPVVADAARFSSDKRFGRIVCAGMMEFVSDPVDILRNAHRLAASQGVMVVLVPLRSLLGHVYRYFHASHNVQVRLFDAVTIVEAASSASWHCECYRRCHGFSGVFRLRKL